MSDWSCYLLTSLDSTATYIGSTNDPQKRLSKHNSGTGAKYTRGKTWIPILIISGFHHKNACLSFEAGWKKLSKNRNQYKLFDISLLDGPLNYTGDNRWKRIMDLLYFVHNVTLLDTKFRINYDIRHPINQPDELTMTIFFEEWITDLPWPYFINFY